MVFADIEPEFFPAFSVFRFKILFLVEDIHSEVSIPRHNSRATIAIIGKLSHLLAVV